MGFDCLCGPVWKGFLQFVPAPAVAGNELRPPGVSRKGDRANRY